MTIKELKNQKAPKTKYCLLGPMISVERAIQDFQSLFGKEPEKIYVIYRTTSNGEPYLSSIHCD